MESGWLIWHRYRHGQPVSEAYSGGPLGGLRVTNVYDSLLRRTNLALVNASGSVLAGTGYGYDAASRLQIVASGANSATYSYLANSPLVDHILFTNNGAFRMMRTNQYDFLDRLLAVSNCPAGGSAIGYAYAYNTASQRTAMTNSDSTYWNFGYDYLGQVTNGCKYTNSSAITDRQFAYFFDDIGNRKQTVSNATPVTYAANLLNQYTSVGGQTWTHDLDGNLLTDTAWTNTWDAENRLVTMTTNGQKLVFNYDWQGRRISKTVSNWVSGAWVLASDLRFAYDGWNLIAVLDSGLALSNSYVWGLDLSGSLQGAGGVGGLLMDQNMGWGVTNFVAYDGNGNVMALVNAADGTSSAQYEYGPFGELLRATGPMAKANPFRFSTKYQDDETDVVIYPRRPYNPSTGRFLCKDPIEERGGLNLYGFLGNNPVSQIDPLGLAGTTTGTPTLPAPGTPPGGVAEGPPGLLLVLNACSRWADKKIVRQAIDRALADCRAQMASRPNGKKCCTVAWCYQCGCVTGSLNKLARVGLSLADNSCDDEKSKGSISGCSDKHDTSLVTYDDMQKP